MSAPASDTAADTNSASKTLFEPILCPHGGASHHHLLSGPCTNLHAGPAFPCLPQTLAPSIPGRPSISMVPRIKAKLPCGPQGPYPLSWSGSASSFPAWPPLQPHDLLGIYHSTSFSVATGPLLKLFFLLSTVRSSPPGDRWDPPFLRGACPFSVVLQNLLPYCSQLSRCPVSGGPFEEPVHHMKTGMCLCSVWAFAH